VDNPAAAILLLSAALAVGGAMLAPVLPRLPGLLATAGFMVGVGAADTAAGWLLVTGRARFEANLYTLSPLGMLQIRADSLAGFFLVLIGALSIGIGFYSWGYMRKFEGHGFKAFGVLVQLLLLSLVGIVLANDLALFLIAWEAMSITSYLLVSFEYRNQNTADAGFLMLAMSQLGTAAFLVGFLLLGSSVHSLGFDQMRASAPALSEAVRAAAFLLFFFGFGTKAGIVPLQVWLPVAHPAAPSNISALLSAVIINMGVYGIIRFAAEMTGRGPAWWGFVVAGTGAISAVLGILFALMERDIKRFLAYSTVENVGIILIGLGSSMVFASFHLEVLAALALIAALFHTLNHATYKGLLFLGAGAIDYAARVRNMDRLGGLVRLMPWTAGLFLIGTVSIAGVAPFSGFASEWLTLEALLQSFHIPDLASKVGLALVGVFLALTAGLAVTAFVKAYGITFLGMARSEDARRAREVPLSMRLGMGILAVQTILLGLIATAFIPWFARVAVAAYGRDITYDVVPDVYAHPGKYPLLIHLGGALFRPVVPAPGPILIPADPNFAAASPTYLFVAFSTGVVVTGLLVWWLTRIKSARQAEVWAGGIETFTPNYQYTASAFANPIRIIFSMIYRPGKEAETQFQASQYFRISVSYRAYVVPFFEQHLYPAIISAVVALSEAAKVLQSGSVNLYLGYIFGILIVVLVLVR